jgi:glycerol uptake facilitator-like aquaporin
MEVGVIELKTSKDFVILAFYEMLGTFILMVAMNFGYYQANVVASGLFVAILLTYKVSGSHLNGGISLGMYIYESNSNNFKSYSKVFLNYILAQIVGAYLGMAICYGVLGHDKSLDMHPKDPTKSVFYVFIMELFFGWIY